MKKRGLIDNIYDTKIIWWLIEFGHYHKQTYCPSVRGDFIFPSSAVEKDESLTEKARRRIALAKDGLSMLSAIWKIVIQIDQIKSA